MALLRSAGSAQENEQRPPDTASSGTVGMVDGTSSDLRIVLVDFKSERRAVMRSIVDLALGTGSVVAEANDGREAENAIDTKAANAVLVEMDMPGDEGPAIMSSLRAAYPNLTLVVCTFRADPTARLRAELAGADAYLVKPVSVRQIRSIAGLILNRGDER